MGKRKSTNDKYVSKGERKSSMKTPNRDVSQKMLNKLAALRKGKDVVFTMPNPDSTQTNKPFVKIRVSGRDYVRNGGYKVMKKRA